MAALNLVSFSLSINVVFPGAGSNNKLKGFRSGGGRLVVRRRKPSFNAVKCSNETTTTTPSLSFKRDDFPSDFKFGASSSALQCEGNIDVGGRGPSTYDSWVLADQGFNGADSYHLYPDDVKALKDMRMNVYRFSISWTRILPKGNLQGGVNQEGIDQYNKLINELVENGISPYVTLCHFEIPKALEDSYMSFIDSKIINDFKDYANVCFKNFGDRVKYWKTFNEPYFLGTSMWKPGNVPESQLPQDGAFTATHHVILAHAYAVDLYRTTYKPQQGGEIGITLAFNWIEPFSSSPEDEAAAQQARDHEFGWYMDAITYGDYPKTMRDAISQLPHFTDEETKLVKGSIDFLGLNYYFTYFAQPAENWIITTLTGFTRQEYVAKGDTNADGFKVDNLGYPKGLRDMLLYVKDKYENPKIVITENGWAEIQKYTTSLQEALATGNVADLQKALIDDSRIYFIMTHLIAILEAISGGANITGYCVWSLMDSMEPLQGYNKRMGLVFTDYFDNCKRYAKKSAKWFSKFLNPIYSSVEYTPKRPQEDSQY